MYFKEERRRFDPFRAQTQEARERHLAAYLHFLEQRDGAVDVERRKLSIRECYFEDLQRDPVKSSVDLDRVTFERNLMSAGTSNLDRRMAWLVVAAKANVGEAYGVERELCWIAESGGIPTGDELYLRMLMQEDYHTRILGEISRTVGVEARTLLPNWNQRVLIHIIMRLPDNLRWTLVICAEVVGSVVFEVLLENCDVFSGEPEVETRVRSLLREILRDEVLHVAYLRAHLSRPGLAIARLIAPLVARAAFLDLPQLAALGASRRELLARVRSGLDIPPDATWMRPDPISDGGSRLLAPVPTVRRMTSSQRRSAGASRQV